MSNQSLCDNIKKILETEENVLFAFVFGSHVSHTTHKESDLDIAIMLKEPLTNVDDYIRLQQILTEATGCSVDIAILNDAAPLLKIQVFTKGKLVFTRAKELVTQNRIKALFEYEDMKRYLEYSYQVKMDRLRT